MVIEDLVRLILVDEWHCADYGQAGEQLGAEQRLLAGNLQREHLANQLGVEPWLEAVKRTGERLAELRHLRVFVHRLSEVIRLRLGIWRAVQGEQVRAQGWKRRPE